MGLFSPGSSLGRIGGEAAHTAIKEIAGRIETELHDTPGEYFALQAAGMLFASKTNAVSGVKPVRSMDESLSRAGQIMTMFSNKSSVKMHVLKVKATEAYDLLCVAAAKGINSAGLVGELNNYLHFVEASHLQRSTSKNIRNKQSQLSPAFAFLAAMLFFPLIVGLGGIIVSLRYPEMKSLTAKAFFAAIAVSGSGQALFFGKKGMAVAFILCAVGVIWSLR